MKRPGILRTGVIFALCLLLAAPAAFAGRRSKKTKSNLKYVFYFIGDGMASVQVHAAEAYLAALIQDDAVPGGTKAELLAMSRFPVQGMSTTFANNRMITGSAAAGTALATGKKTNINVISMDPETTIPYNSIAEKAKEKGMKVGIVSSVTINHATPAVFYSHTPTRKNYQEIAQALADSDFDYFGGGYWNSTGNDSVEPAATDNGFVITDDLAALQAQAPGTRVIARDALQQNPAKPRTGALLYEIDRPADGISLSRFTEEGIRLLDNENGFFMMVEGGKIDWACHANDARAAIEDTIAFDDAIKKAVDFYHAHPDETLIVVTADHECGGQTIGFAGTGYDTFFEVLANQTMSFEAFNATVLAEYQATHNPAPADIDVRMWQIIFDNFGLDGAGLSAGEEDDLSAFQIQQLEAAFDKTMSATSVNLPEEDKLLYGYYEPLTVTLTHLLNQEAGIGWTSYSHTGVPVPVLAMGKYAQLFDGFYDNTDVALKIARAMGFHLDN